MTRYALLPLFLLLAACATTSSTDGPHRDFNEITPEEVEEALVSSGDAYTIIRRLRPQWLNKRGQHSIMFEGDIAVYLNQMRYGTPPSLREISADDVYAAEFYDAAKATNRFGINHDHGAIVIWMKPGGEYARARAQRSN